MDNVFKIYVALKHEHIKVAPGGTYVGVLFIFRDICDL